MLSTWTMTFAGQGEGESRIMDWRFCSTAVHHYSKASIMSKGNFSVLRVIWLHYVVALAAASQ